MDKRTAYLRRLTNPESAIPDAIQAAADERYRMWHSRDPREEILATIRWPDEAVEMARATAIGYRSDKWNAVGKNRDYIHHFDQPYPRVLAAPERDRNGKVRLAPKVPAKPKYPVFVVLGRVLDVQIVGKDGKPSHLDWKGQKPLPLLAVDTSKNVLIIVPEQGGSALLLDSPIVEITPRGIEN